MGNLFTPVHFFYVFIIVAIIVFLVRFSMGRLQIKSAATARERAIIASARSIPYQDKELKPEQGIKSSPDGQKQDQP